MGYCAEIVITFESAGGNGKFFFVSEEDWIFSQLIVSKNHDLILCNVVSTSRLPLKPQIVIWGISYII